DGLFKDRWIGCDAAQIVAFNLLLKVAAGYQGSANVVIPNALSEFLQFNKGVLAHLSSFLGDGRPLTDHRRRSTVYGRRSFIDSRAAATTFSTVKPKCLSSSFNGADAPKSRRATIRPSMPTYRRQPRLVPASTATRARTDGGRTDARYSSVCRSNSSQQGMLTTRDFIPSVFNFS